MNDFTKDELESILRWADVYCEFEQSWTYKIHKPLMDKLLSMLDNYCDHEYKVFAFVIDGEQPKGNSFSIFCEKCNHVLADSRDIKVL